MNASSPSRIGRSRPAMLVAASLILAGACTAGPGSTAAPTDPPVATREDCPVTRPEPAFHAPAPFPEVPPASYGSAWYGTADLFTMIDLGGEVWTDLPAGPNGLGQKSFWWSTAFTEIEPAIVVAGERLDAPGSFETSGLGTNAGADFGRAMLIGIEIPAAGCWRLTGTYRGTSLSYVVWAGPLVDG